MQVRRNLPLNINEGDIHLFAHELFVEVELPVLKTCHFLYADLYCFSAARGLNHFTHSQLRYTKMKLRKLFSPRLVICSETAIVFDDWSANYFHWITEVVPRLVKLEELKNNIKIRIPDFILRLNFVRDTITLFRHLHFLELTINKKTKFLIKKVYLCDLKINSGNYHPEVIKQAKAFILNAMMPFSSFKYFTPQRVFIHRDNLGERGIMNFADIKPLLDSFNIQVINFGELKLHQQIELMQNCELLMGVHGAGLTNMIFLPRGSRVFEFRRFDDSSNNCFFSLASACDLSYYYQLCKVDDKGLKTQQNRFFIDFGKLSETLNLIFN